MVRISPFRTICLRKELQITALFYSKTALLCNLRLRVFRKQRLQVGGDNGAPVLSYTCDA